MTLTGYFDESVGGNPKHFVLSGYVSDRRGWQMFEREWRAALKDENLPYLHMKEFEHGQDGTPFERFGGHDKRDLRERIQRRFVAIVANPRFNLFGLYAAFREDDFATVAPLMEKFFPGKGRGKPYLLAFELVIHRFFAVLRAHGYAFTDDELVNFVFDQRSDNGIAKSIYDHLVKYDRIKFRAHLGMLCFADMRKFVALQASDMLAYEAMKERTRGDRPRRPLYDRLFSKDQVSEFTVGPDIFEYWQEMMASAIENHEGTEAEPYR